MTILFVGSRNFPHEGTASDNRLSFFANALASANKIVCLNRYSSTLETQFDSIELSNNIFITSIIKSYRTKSILSKLLYLLSVIYEPLYILKMNRKEKIKVIHVYSGHYIDFLHYFLISRFIKAKVVYQYVEYRSAIRRNGLYHKLNGKLCDRYGALLWDGVIPISHFLEDAALKVNPQLMSLRVTPLCDFALFNKSEYENPIEGDYIMYCGSVGYSEPIDLIIDSYNKSKLSGIMKLVMVLSGDSDLITKYKKNNPNVIVKSRLSFPDLISHYKNAKILLIPLRNTIQDIARFPNKVCEYTAVGGVILTSNYGEIPYFFKDGENAIIANDFSVESFSNKMNEIVDEKYDLVKLRTNSYETGLNHFSIDSYSRALNVYFEKIVSN